MIRRQFIKLATLTGATGLASFGALDAVREGPTSTAGAEQVPTVTWHVRGFTCVTCAVGLETLLRREKGVIAAVATYPQGMVKIQYHPDLVSQNALRSTIAELGFTADDKMS
ncbi:MAG: heavy-metal-associated domain-containing protein [Terracidiphilus sp.]